MIAALPPSASAWTDEQRALYYAHMSAWQKDEVVGVLLALFLGTFGAHHFYLRRPGLGILYCVFFWTGIPTVVSFIECFFMPGRVRQYNLALATYFAFSISAASSMAAATAAASANVLLPAGAVRACLRCGAMILTGAHYCGNCGAKAE
ncbi:MAG TPA: TM2 domain-containing protein [Acidobacteriaceae bacterium]|nr:TM2 domain-containing protein [Acidobacteriaceae bacterium]